MQLTLLGTEPYRRGYGTDERGRNWATFQGPAVPCAICGASIHRGWHLSPRDTPEGSPEQHVCSSHVTTREPSTA